MGILRTGATIGVAVHHSAYQKANNMSELMAQASLFNTWHKSKSWAEDTKTDSAYPYISYHYLMATDGSVLNVTDEKYVKYHAGDNFRGALSFNLHGVSICLTGNYETDVPTDAQMRALVVFIRDIEKRYKIDAMVRGHKETSADPTACPGTNIGTSKSGWLKQVIANVNNKDYPPQAPVMPPEQTECEKQVNGLKAQVQELEAEIIELNDTVKERGATIKKLEGELEQKVVEFSELSEEYRNLEEKNKMLEEERLLLQEKQDKELKAYRRWDWLISFLNAIIPTKK
jgi:N-acetyl-anhydromuramyl-L-alanine amidase AmpD